MTLPKHALKLALTAGALALVSAVPAQTASPARSQPPFGGGFCIQVIVYGTNPATGECRQFPNPCVVPAGWTISYTGCASAS